MLLAAAVLFSCGRKNKVEKEVVVYHDAACDVDTTTMASHNLIQGDAAIAARHNAHYHQGTNTGTSGSTTRSENYYTQGTTVSRPHGAGAATYKRPADPTDPEVGMDEFDRKHTTVQHYNEPAKPGVTGTGATQASGTGTSAGRPIN